MSLNLETLHLDKGAHRDCGEGQGPVCLLEAVACYAGNPFSDHPETTSPVLAAFGRAINDAMPDDRRQELKQFIPRLVNTAGHDELDRRHAFLLTDWAVRKIAPMAFDSAAGAMQAAVGQLRVDGLQEAAESLTRHVEVLGAEAGQLRDLQPVDGQLSAKAAWSAAESAAWSAESAESAAWSAGSAAKSAKSAESAAWSAEAAKAAWSAEAAKAAWSAATWDECIRFFDQLIDLGNQAV